MKYKILFVNLFPEIGGAETSLIYLIETLDKNKFIPFVIVPKEGLFSQRLEKIARVIYLPLPGYFIRTLFVPGFNLLALFKFLRLCHKIKPDIIYLNHLTLAFYTGIARWIFSIPTIAISWVDSDCVYFFQNIISNFGCNLILPISQELQNNILEKGFISSNKIKVIYPGIDYHFFSAAESKSLIKKTLGIDPQNIVISIVSRFDPIKDHLTFLQATNIIIQKKSHITILIAQDYTKNLDENTNFAPTIKRKIDQFLNHHPKLKKQIIFTGYKQNILPIYQATDILVSSSLYESLGISLIEGASCNLPIVTTDAGTQKLVVKDNINGFLVPIKNPQKMAEKILILVKDKKLRNEFGQNGRKHVINNFSIFTYVRKIQDICLTLIAHSSSST